MIYFIYNEIQITNIGGVTIPTIAGINGGFGVYGPWLLGTADDASKLNLIKEFNPEIISEDVWRGLSLIDQNEIFDPILGTIQPLTADEIYKKNLAINWVARRNAYDSELGGWREQLDLMQNDFNLWKSKIKDIKDRLPKPILGG